MAAIRTILCPQCFIAEGANVVCCHAGVACIDLVSCRIPAPGVYARQACIHDNSCIILTGADVQDMIQIFTIIEGILSYGGYALGDRHTDNVGAVSECIGLPHFATDGVLGNKVGWNRNKSVPSNLSFS